MFAIIGIIVVFAGVFGGYILAGGKMYIIIQALPFEMMMIGGAAVGAFLLANSKTTMGHVAHSFSKVFKGSKYTRDSYKDLLCCLFALTKLMKTKGVVAIEGHIEKPDESDIFKKYPAVMNDHHAVTIIRDTIRLMTMDMTDPMEMEDALQKQLDKMLEEELHASHALQTMADGLPALGIVAAVLGVIKTMGSITEPPAILGKMIGGALTGTFLGVFLSYGLVAPMASRLAEIAKEEIVYFYVIRDVLVSYLRNKPAQVAVEIGRGLIPTHLQPTFYEIEEAVNAIQV